MTLPPFCIIFSYNRNGLSVPYELNYSKIRNTMSEQVKKAVTERLDSNKDYYYRLRKKIESWLAEKGTTKKAADVIMLAPDMFYLLWKLSINNEVSLKSRGILAGAVVYFVSPLDLMPELIFGPMGFLDDIALGAYVLNRIINDTPPQIIKKYWVGENDLLMVVKSILINADRLLGKGLWNRLKRRLK